VGVCPNIALLTYATASVRADLPTLAVSDGAVRVVGSAPFVAVQRHQVAVLADLCNECGACVAVCPTAGRPYRDKPRLYLDEADWEAESSNAYRIPRAGAMEARFDGRTHRIEVRAPGPAEGGRGDIAYTAPGFTAVLDGETFAVLDVSTTGVADADAPSLEPAAVMATLLAGLTGSLPHLPTGRTAGSRVSPPRLDG
jgi:putative selenate reductase